MHSYKDLPLRMGELGIVHRHELSGALHGLMRVRCFTQDDAHIFMTREQIKDEIKGVVQLIDSVYSTFGFKYHIELSTQPEDSMGAKEDWDIATQALRDAITELGYDFEVNEGDGAFYGPKLDFHLTDCLGRTWQCGTIQLDFQLPERFELEYVGADGEKHRPIMIHRVVFGSIERFIGILTEHFAGAFPTWLAPVQVKLLPIADRHIDYLNTVKAKLEAAGIRCEVDDRSEKIGFKIRSAQMEKVPYMLVAGDKELSDRLMVAKQYCYLKDLTYKGAHMRYGDVLDEKTEERIKYELSTIEWMGFPGYFLIVWDYIRAAREMGVSVGPGRGSAAGSVVAYCLKITNIDPLKYDLIFSRFLVPERCGLSWKDELTVLAPDITLGKGERYVEMESEGKTYRLCTDARMRVIRNGEERTIYADELMCGDEILFDRRDCLWNLKELETHESDLRTPPSL